MSKIRMNVIRDDGEVTQIEGDSGIAVCMGPLAEDPLESEPPLVILRCYKESELAWNLAAVMGAVKHQSPRAFEAAKDLMELCDFDKPLVSHTLPRPPINLRGMTDAQEQQP